MGGLGMGLPAGPVINLIYYASVSKGAMIVAQHRADSMDLAPVAAQCLEKVPDFHSRFTYTIKRKIFSCIIDGPFTYCAIVDEALTKYNAFVFLEDVRDEFKVILHDQGMQQDGQGLEPYCLTDIFSTVFRHLITPFVGVPQKEVDRIEEEAPLAQQNGEYEDDTYIDSGQPEVSISDHNVSHSNHNHHHKHERVSEKNSERRFRFSPLRGKGAKADKKKVKDQVIEVKEIMMENIGKALDKGQKLEVMVEGGSTPEASHHLQKSRSARLHAHRMWWNNVKLVLILDAVVCAILFAIWLGICKGFQCVK